MFITAAATTWILSSSVAQARYCEQILLTREQLLNLQALTESDYIAVKHKASRGATQAMARRGGIAHIGHAA
jgi:hypothetical protein